MINNSSVNNKLNSNKEARQSARGINENLVEWINMNYDLLTLVLDGVQLKQILQCPVGNWSSVAVQLAQAIQTEIGKELFLVPHGKVLEETVQLKTGTVFTEWVSTASEVSENTCRIYLLKKNKQSREIITEESLRLFSYNFSRLSIICFILRNKMAEVLASIETTPGIDQWHLQHLDREVPNIFLETFICSLMII